MATSGAVIEKKSKHNKPKPQKHVSLDIEKEVEELSKLELITEDGIPLESNWHRIQINLLIDLVLFLWRDRTDYFVGGNMFIYYNRKQVKTLDYRGPDVFVVNNVDGTAKRECWVVWDEAGRYPDVIIELASPSTIKNDLGVKKRLYEQTFRTQEYFCYNPDTEELFGWQLIKGRYEGIEPNEQGWLYSTQLEVWIGKWQGEWKRENTTWLRFYTEEKQLLPTTEEFEAERAQAAEAEIEKLRSVLAKHGL